MFRHQYDVEPAPEIPSITKHTVMVLSGPMSGLIENNYPAFDDLAESLRCHGFAVNNPTEYDFAETEWGYYIGVCLGEMKKIQDQGKDAVLVQLQGWRDSPGAKLEEYFATEILDWKVMRACDVLRAIQTELEKEKNNYDLGE